MQTERPKPARMIRKAPWGFIAMMMAGIGLGNVAVADDDTSTCPWIVQPEEPAFGLARDMTTYEILFTGQTAETVFYGFSATDHKLTRQLTRDGEIPDLEQSGRSLETVERDRFIVYQVSAETIEPRVIYLVAAASPIPRLEQIDARIDPARPIAVGLRTRGASDVSGPLPRRTFPGIDIMAAASKQREEERTAIASANGPDFKLCAYQVSWN